MLLEPGPIPPLATSWYPTTYDVPDFEAMTTAALAETDTLLREMDALIDPAAIFDEALTGDTIMQDLETVDQINGDNAHLANLSGIANIDGMKYDGDLALTAVVQKGGIPGEAFTPVPAATQWGTQTPAAPTAAIAGVALANLSGGDPSTFQVFDQYQLVVRMDTTTGQVYDYWDVHVWASLTKDGAQQPDLDLGHTDSTGQVLYRGQYGLADQGAWAMYVNAAASTGGEVVSQLYQWTVGGRAHGGPRPGEPAVTVVLQNVSGGSLNNATEGDSWQLTVTGGPNYPVYIWGSHDGAALPEAQLGTTDAQGSFTLTGVWTHADSGDWVERYAVGRATWPGQLIFTVSPRPPEPTGSGGARTG